MALTSNPDHPDEVVQPEKEVPSQLVAEAKLRHENADSDLATPQEKRQAAVERAHAMSTRPDGSYAQLHETEEPTLAVADEQHLGQLKARQEEAVDALRGSPPANSPASVRSEQSNAAARKATSAKVDK